ncbi:MAG: hypothetical protein HQK60_07705, partial [Deltaproteobacteria bacterium]|nr:hypothetical protein [Deltaproteobacteria bacterium]
MGQLRLSIHAKLLLLVLLGALGIFLVSGVNMYLDVVKEKGLQIQSIGQDIARGILKTMLTEQHFIRTQDQALLAS